MQNFDINKFFNEGYRNENSLFIDCLHECFSDTTTQRYLSLLGITYTKKNNNANALLNGLYQATQQNKALSLPFDYHFYSGLNKKIYNAPTITRDIINLAKELEYSGIINIHKGQKDFYCTLLNPTQKLEGAFSNTKESSTYIYFRNEIILKNRNKKPINYTPSIKKSKIYNKIRVSLNPTKQKEFIRTLNEVNARYKIILPPTFKPKTGQHIALNNTYFYRVFNEGFSKGGRFYGHYIQSLNSNTRNKIKLSNGNTIHDVVEIDYKCLHINMLYDIAETPNNYEDAYHIDGFKRKDVKLLLLMSLNAKDDNATIGAFFNAKTNKHKTKSNYNYKDVKQMLDAIKLKHEPIKDFIASECGIYLQRLDSEIANLIMQELVSLQKPIFPIHDSFIVRSCDKELLIESMQRNYDKVMGAKTCVEITM